MIKIILLFAIVLLVTFTGIYLTRSKPILLRYGQSSAKSTGAASFVVFNPFRDRSPEQKAADFLELIKEQPCVQVLAGLSLNQERFQYLCQMESEHRLTSWRLADREEIGNKAKLFYWSRRTQSLDFKSQLWITMENTSGYWKVVEYESWY